MRASLLPLLRCPRCRAERSLTMTARASDDREVREGELACERCATTFAIRDGIVDLLHDPPEFVVREAAGLDRFADVMRADGWDRERILALPEAGDLAYWHAQREAMQHVLAVADFEPGQRLYFIHRYVLAARAAGFRIAAPWRRGIRAQDRRWPDAHRLAPLERALGERAAGRALIDAKRIARYAWRHVLAGDRSLLRDCVKPA